MGEKYPCMEVDLNKITHNTRFIVSKCKEKGIDVFGVTKVFCANIPIVKAMIKGGIVGVADARIKNLIKMQELPIPKVLLRIPEISEAYNVIKYSDISFNSEYKTIEKLSEVAVKQGSIHKIILMVDLGDLREGIWENNIVAVTRNIIKLSNIDVIGIGTNLTCYGGIIPNDHNLGELVNIKNMLRNEVGLDLKIISGGNSSSLYKVFDGTIPNEINNLRIGEAIVLGRETAYGKHIEGCYCDAFTIKGEIVEIKQKPSLPIGTIGKDAFGNIPHFEDKGIMKRAIVALGRQDVNIDGMFPYDNNIEILGASSDHLILDVTHSYKEYNVGDVIDFNVDYSCLLRAMTSEYVNKYYK